MISRQRAIPVVSAEIQKKSDAKGAKNDNMKKRLQRICSCVLLCAALLCAALPAPAAAASTGFSDVPATHWAADSIRRAVDLGLFQGQTATRFGLGAPMTRGAFVTALCRLFGWEMVTPETGSYADNQDKTAWYYSAVETAYANGAITHQTDTFRPRDPITREELAVMLIRLYDSYHAAAPDKIGIAYSAEGLTNLTGYEAVAVGGTRLIYAGESRLTGGPDAEEAAALRQAVTDAGAAPLLYVSGTSTALKDSADHTAEVLTAAVESGGYEGLFLDLAELQPAQKKDFTALAEALRASLGEDRLFYVMVEAPVWQGTAYGGYDYAALGQLADRLVVRVAAYDDSTGSFPIAPLEPLEEVYYALAELRDQVDSDRLSLLVTTTGSAWTGGRSSGTISAAEIEALLASAQTQDYSADRYACAYLTADDGSTAVWYLDGASLLERARMAAFFGVDQLCLSDLSSVADYENYDLLGSLTAEP